MYQKTVLDNGVRIISERLPQALSATLGLWLLVGSRDEEPHQGGVSHFIEHMAFKGTDRRDALAIAREFDRLGGMANAFTGKEQTCFHARGLASHLPQLSDLLLDLLLNPTYDPQEVERERQVILQEIACVEDTPDDLVYVLFGHNVYPEHALGRPILGTSDTVGGMDRQMVLAYLQDSYAPHNLVVTAVGDLDHQQVVDLVAPSLDRLETRPGAPARQAPLSRPGLNVHRRQTEQAHVVLGVPALAAGDPQRFVGAIMNVILGGNMSSRLFQEIREKRGLAYSVYSYLSSYSDCGMLQVYLGVQPSRATEAVKVVRAEMERLAAETVSEAELTDAKEHLKGSILLGLENPDARIGRLARNEFNFGRHVPLDELVGYIEAVTAPGLQALAQALLDFSQANLTLLGPLDQKRVAKELGL